MSGLVGVGNEYRRIGMATINNAAQAESARNNENRMAKQAHRANQVSSAVSGAVTGGMLAGMSAGAWGGPVGIAAGAGIGALVGLFGGSL